MLSYVDEGEGLTDHTGYRTEGCDDDPNWCFRSAVGSSLPSTFFSYPNTSFANASSIANDTNTADVSPDQSLLSFGTTGSSTSYSPPSPNQWPVALGDLDPEYDQVNAVLSEAALDEQGAPAVSQRSFLLSSTTQQHRFVARHMRKFARGGSRSHGMRRDELSGTGQVEFSPTESAMSKGYEDGWDAAGTFANFNGSRLGELLFSLVLGDTYQYRLHWAVYDGCFIRYERGYCQQ